jgi:DNA-binding CsgD family transcriptional regulator/PAS domain-containing protein
VADTDFRSTAPLLDLVGDLYDCAIDPTRWPATCERLARLVNGVQTAIALHDTVTQQVSLKASWNVDPALEEAMKANFAINPLVPAVWYTDIDEPFSAIGFLGEREFKDSYFYRHVVAPFGIGDSALSLLAKSVRQFGSLSIQRLRDQPAFAPEELALLRLLAPHIRRAVMIADLLDARALERNMLTATLDLMNAGVVLADDTGRIAFANQAAQRWLEDGSVLRRRGDQISAADAACADDLNRAIADAAGGTTIDIPRSGIVVPLKAASGSDLAAWVLPLDGGLRRELGAGFAARCALFIRELGNTSPFPAELFVRRYAITPAECRVMMLLVQGMTITEAAGMLGISVPTARTHLARLFDKTGTSRQADLVRLAMSALAPTAGH